MLLQWNDSFNLGIPVIDRQHLELYNMVNLLSSAMEQGRGKHVAADIMSRLSSLVRDHFAEEEKTLRKIDSPHYTECCRRHQQELAMIHDFVSGKSASDPSAVIDLLYLLDGLLDGHIDFERQALGLRANESIH